MKMSRTWAMPNHRTFEIPPIRDFIKRYASGAKVIVDPFSGQSRIATLRNDLNPAFNADAHMKADEWLESLAKDGVQADIVLLDPPYSPRQISECYKAAGLTATMKDTQNAAFLKRVRTAADAILKPGGLVLSFGWNSGGMGKKRRYKIEEILLVCHGAAHNDTICLAERKPE